MFAAIVAAIGVIFTGISGMVKSSSNKLMAKQAEMQANVDYERGKTLGIYGMVDKEKATLLMIIGLGMGLIVFIIYMNTKKG